MKSVACLLLLGFAACVPTETGNPSFNAQLALTADSSDPDLVTLGAAEAPVNILEAWVNIGDVRFISAEDCDAMQSERVDVPGPIIVDLASGPNIEMLLIEASEYCRVRVPLERATLPLPMGAPAALQDHTIAVRGDTGDGVGFTLRSRMREEADVRSRGEPFALDEAQGSLLLSFDVATWFAGVDLTSAELDPSGQIVIDDDQNEGLLGLFEANVKAALRLFRDLDEDGELEDEERREGPLGQAE